MGCLVESPKNYFCITAGKCVTTDTEIKSKCSNPGDTWTRDYMVCTPNFNCAVSNSTTESNPELIFTSPFFNRILVDNRLADENGTTIT